MRRVPTQKPHFDVGDRVRERFPARGTPHIGVVTKRYELHEQYRYVVHFDDGRDGVFFEWELAPD